VNGYGYSTFVQGDVFTGGTIPVLVDTTVTGEVGTDPTGTDPRLVSCRQAIDDMRAASSFLAGLAPTRSLGSIRLKPGGFLVLAADPGVNVWSATEIQVSGPVPPPYTSAGITIQLASGTESVIINTAKLGMRGSSWIQVLGPDGFAGDASKVVFNLPGRRPSVRVRGIARLDPILLAPERSVRLGIGVDTFQTRGNNNTFARRVTGSKGPVYTSFTCSRPVATAVAQ
jgi:choice-of-anchor A domain-containing protein